MREFDIELTRRIKGDEPLVKVLNDTLERMNLAKMTSAPTSFSDLNDEALQECPRHYCELLLCERWLHEVVWKLRDWESKIAEYFSEFGGEWRYYACSKRLEAIKEFGGDDSDYDESGNIITEGLSDEKLNGFTIIDELFNDDWRDIVQETKPEELSLLWAVLQLDANVSVSDMFRNMGHEIPMYKMNEYGEVERMTREDEDLMKAAKSVSADDTMTVVRILASFVYIICRKLSRADKYRNNTELVERVSLWSDALLRLDFEQLSVESKKMKFKTTE